MFSVSEHWTYYDVDTCPKLNTYPYLNGSSDHWSLDRSPIQKNLTEKSTENCVGWSLNLW